MRIFSMYVSFWTVTAIAVIALWEVVKYSRKQQTLALAQANNIHHLVEELARISGDLDSSVSSLDFNTKDIECPDDLEELKSSIRYARIQADTANKAVMKLLNKFERM